MGLEKEMSTIHDFNAREWDFSYAAYFNQLKGRGG
jgi:hypothetical protein